MEDVQRRNGLYGFDFLEADQRRASEGRRKTYEIKQLWQRSHEIVNLAAQGFKNVEIAQILNVTPECISQTLNSELGMKKLSEIRQDRDQEAKKISEKIRVITDKCLTVYHEIFDDESGELGLKDKGNFASEFLKEMSGLRAPTKIQSHNIHTSLTREELEEFKKRGQQASQEAGFVYITEVSSNG